MSALLALAGVVYLLNYDWIYSSLFFDVRSPWRVAADLAVPLLLVLGVSLLGAAMFGARRVAKASDLLVIVGLALVGYSMLKAYGAIGGHLPAWLKVVGATAVLASAFAAVKRLPDASWERLRLAVVVGSVLFIASPLVFARFDSAKSLSLSPAFHDPQAGPRVATVVLILDEWSESAAAPIVQALGAGGRTVQVKGVLSSGQHTISSIPGLLTGRAFDHARACTASALCADAGLFDFARQEVSVPNFNVSGSYHPYCTMKGLAYCRQFGVLGFDNGLVAFGCNFATLLSLGHQYAFCESQWLTAGKIAASRQQVREAAFDAPFWKTGGVLYIHVLLPHPPGVTEGQSLDQDYADNLVLASGFARELLTRLESRFGDDFLFVLSSDHPLRPAVWCATHKYRQAACEASRRFTSDKVPLVAVGREAASLMALDDNFGLFERVLRVH